MQMFPANSAVVLYVIPFIVALGGHVDMQIIVIQILPSLLPLLSSTEYYIHVITFALLLEWVAFQCLSQWGCLTLAADHEDLLINDHLMRGNCCCRQRSPEACLIINSLSLLSELASVQQEDHYCNFLFLVRIIAFTVTSSLLGGERNVIFNHIIINWLFYIRIIIELRQQNRLIVSYSFNYQQTLENCPFDVTTAHISPLIPWLLNHPPCRDDYRLSCDMRIQQ